MGLTLLRIVVLVCCDDVFVSLCVVDFGDCWIVNLLLMLMALLFCMLDLWAVDRWLFGCFVDCGVVVWLD